ncbi:uncharacterized protein BYT42DRAFT_552778 [Radiomyces spectabilis]|uniref:uncharacterized protein n=1 Tax=Radiomyces spectabilis TaxID=64574 RepID=UPI002221039E|nr:uncharacterized protein BYT42DRAFT_552778 [Radiomyces spectabilis]KAI8393939.1 hypothetical protein BYT42DRAFT_552778 [Radiomyces spectabilis]
MSGSETNQDSENASRLVLRTYRATDHDYVLHVFYSAAFGLVPEGIKRKLMSPVFWTIWLTSCYCLVTVVPAVISGAHWPRWILWLMRIALVLGWILAAFVVLFIFTDRWEVVGHIEEAQQNDLSDPEVYYLNWVKKEVIVDDSPPVKPSSSSNKKRVTFDKSAKPATEMVRTLRPAKEQTLSHFWVLAMDNVPIGMVGLANYRERVYDNRISIPSLWDALRETVSRWIPWLSSSIVADRVVVDEDDVQDDKRVFAEPHAPKSATLQRLAVKPDYQGCGLSTLLINNVMLWAHKQGLESIYATTNEMQQSAQTILHTRHGFQKIKKTRKGWLGQYEIVWKCTVDQWMKDHEDLAKQLL